jgi:hypothetical protein
MGQGLLELYCRKCQENRALTEKIDLLEHILHSFLPIVENDQRDSEMDKPSSRGMGDTSK